MIYQSDEEFYNSSGDGSDTDSDEEVRAQIDAEEFPLGHHGPDSAILERLGEADGDGTERTVARDLILQEINKSVQTGVEGENVARNRKRGRSQTGKSSRKATKKSKRKRAAARSNKKLTRYDNITGELTKEYLEKYRNVWKVRKIQRDKRRRGHEILKDAPKLDQYVIESFVYTDHRFELPYKHPIESGPGGVEENEQPQKDEQEKAAEAAKVAEMKESFHEDVARRWAQAHPDKPLEYLDSGNRRKRYVPGKTSWEGLPWNLPSEWFLDVSKLIEDDRLCIIQMLYEVTIDPYQQLIDSLPLKPSE
ncbi:MAG: hypothetical protein ACTSUE_26465 [Promethearchaeota archaeon]